MPSHTNLIIGLSAGLLIVFVWHFATVFGFIGSPPETRAEFFIRVGIIALAFLGTSAITAAIMANKTDTNLEPDEREEQIYLRAERVGSVVVYLGLILLMWIVFAPLTPMQTANAILGIVWIAEFVKLIAGIRYIRHGV